MAATTGDGVQTCQRAIRPSVLTPRLLRLAMWSILLAAATYTTTDPDLWGHVRFGLDMIHGAAVPSLDPYSFTTDRVWINHEWLAEIAMAGAFRIGGDFALIVLKIAAIGVMLLLVNATLQSESLQSAIARDTAAALALILGMDQMRHVRPQLFSIACFAGLMWCVIASRRRSPVWLLLVPPLFALWANLHGGWLVGGAVFALWIAAGSPTFDTRRNVLNLSVGVASLAATLLTPYHFQLWTFLRETVAFGRADIVEWQPIYALGWVPCLRWAFTAAMAAAGAVLIQRRDERPERIAVLVALGVASFLVARLETFFALAVLFLVWADIGSLYQRARSVQDGQTRHPFLPGAAAACVASVATLLVVANVGDVRIDSRFTPAPGAVRFLQSQRPGRLLVWFDWGEYAIWHLAPHMRVSIDGRRETAYSDQLQQQHLRFYFDAPGGSSLPADLAADYVWIPRALPAVRRLETNGWHRVYDDGTSVIFGIAAAATVHPSLVLARAGESRIFPGP
jgi:hypothetical protein